MAIDKEVVQDRLDFHWRQVRDAEWLSHSFIKHRRVPKDDATRGLQSAIFDTFALRFRNLGEFLFYPPHRQYARAADYCNLAEAGLAKMPPAIKSAMTRANTFVQHFSKAMIAQAEPEQWPFTGILVELDEALQKFSMATNPKFVFERYDQPREWSHKATFWTPTL